MKNNLLNQKPYLNTKFVIFQKRINIPKIFRKTGNFYVFFFKSLKIDVCNNIVRKSIKRSKKHLERLISFKNTY